MAKAKGFGALARNVKGMQARYPEGARVVALFTVYWCAPCFQVNPKVCSRVVYLELVIMLPYIPCCLL